MPMYRFACFMVLVLVFFTSFDKSFPLQSIKWLQLYQVKKLGSCCKNERIHNANDIVYANLRLSSKSLRETDPYNFSQAEEVFEQVKNEIFLQASRQIKGWKYLKGPNVSGRYQAFSTFELSFYKHDGSEDGSFPIRNFLFTIMSEFSGQLFRVVAWVSVNVHCQSPTVQDVKLLPSSSQLATKRFNDPIVSSTKWSVVYHASSGANKRESKTYHLQIYKQVKNQIWKEYIYYYVDDTFCPKTRLFLSWYRLDESGDNYLLFQIESASCNQLCHQVFVLVDVSAESPKSRILDVSPFQHD